MVARSIGAACVVIRDAGVGTGEEGGRGSTSPELNGCVVSGRVTAWASILRGSRGSGHSQSCIVRVYNVLDPREKWKTNY